MYLQRNAIDIKPRILAAVVIDLKLNVHVYQSHVMGSTHLASSFMAFYYCFFILFLLEMALLSKKSIQNASAIAS